MLSRFVDLEILLVRNFNMNLKDHNTSIVKRQLKFPLFRAYCNHATKVQVSPPLDTENFCEYAFRFQPGVIY